MSTKQTYHVFDSRWEANAQLGGVSVTTTLPHGRPTDVKRQIDWLVEKGPQVGLMLGCSSSIAPGVPIENIRSLIESFRHYRKNGWG